jgi:HEAT repeat protein
MLGLLTVLLVIVSTVPTESFSQVVVVEIHDVDNPAMIQGLFAALDDRNAQVVSRAFEEIKKASRTPGISNVRLKEYANHVAPYLRSPNAYLRAEAARTLATMGTAAAQHVQQVLPLLADAGGGVPSAAVDMLIAVGPEAAPYAKHILPLLKDENSSLRAHAIRGLAAMGPGAAEYAQHLLPLFEDDEGTVRWAAAIAFAKIDPAAAQHLLPLIASKKWTVRWTVSLAFAAMGPNAAQYAQDLFPLLKDENAGVRNAVPSAFAAMGPNAAQYAKHLLPLLTDDSGSVRLETARAFMAMGTAGAPYAKHLVPLFRDKSGSIRDAASAVFAAMGPAAARFLLPLLKDKNGEVRNLANKAFGTMSPSSSQQAHYLLPLLKDSDPDMRWAAVSAFAAMGQEASKKYAQLLLPLLKDPDDSVRWMTANAFARMGPTVVQYDQELLPLLKDSNGAVRLGASAAFGAMGASASRYAQDLLPLLGDENHFVRNSVVNVFSKMDATGIHFLVPLLKDGRKSVRLAAVEVFAYMKPGPSQYAQYLVPLLKDEDKDVRGTAVAALAKIGPAASLYAQEVLPLLGDQDSRWSAVMALTAMSPVSLDTFAGIIAQAQADFGNRELWLLRAHMAGGGDSRIERLIRRLGRAPEEVEAQVTVEEARESLQDFSVFWPYTENYPRLRNALAAQISVVAHSVRDSWTKSDISLLRQHEVNLSRSYGREATIVRSVTPSEEKAFGKINIGLGVAAAHAGFWMLLVFFYPRSSKVQAFIFWDHWMRRVAGFWYVDFLLTWVSFLRELLLAPFKEQLIADAELERLSSEVYFERAMVRVPGTQRIVPLREAISHLRGQIILEGSSGLGKSMFIRHLLRSSKQLTVCLQAWRCKDGVMDALQKKLKGPASGSVFLSSIIYSGALHVYIDGLNEVAADTRARIIEFVESNPKGNILIATQRIEWTPPSLARLYALQPFDDGLIVDFLVAREPLIESNAHVRGEAYVNECRKFVREALPGGQSSMLIRANREVLSNPMDLTVVSRMLSYGRKPDLLHLREQQFGQMAMTYREMHSADFPLKKFSEAVYQMRLAEEAVIPDGFEEELKRMEAEKMVVRRGSGWRFRHDKIQEFFIAQTFLGKANPRMSEHMDKPEFRGVYLLLALLLDVEEARALRDMLVEHAAETREHTLSDEVVSIFKARLAVENDKTPKR